VSDRWLLKVGCAQRSCLEWRHIHIFLIGDNDKELNRRRDGRRKNWVRFRAGTWFFSCVTCSSAVDPNFFRVQWVRWAVLASKSAGACYWTLTGFCFHIQLRWRFTTSPPMCGCWIGHGITISCTSGIPSLGIYRNLGVSLLNLNKSWSCWDTTSLQGLCCLLSSILCHIQQQLNSVSWFTPLTQFMRDSRISNWPFVLKSNVLNVTHQRRKRGAFYPSTVVFSALQESYSAMKCTINVTIIPDFKLSPCSEFCMLSSG